MAAPAAATELWLAPGKSVTIFDAADPAVRLVITAPATVSLSTGYSRRLSAGWRWQLVGALPNGEVYNTLGTGVTGILTGQMSVDEVLESLDKAWG